MNRTTFATIIFAMTASSAAFAAPTIGTYSGDTADASFTVSVSGDTVIVSGSTGDDGVYLGEITGEYTAGTGCTGDVVGIWDFQRSTEVAWYVCDPVDFELNLGDGDDEARVDHQIAATVYGEEGNDYLRVATANESTQFIYGGPGDDIITSGAGADFLYGNSGNDFIEGGAGDDIIRGNSGQDELYGDDGDDVIRGNGGADYMEGNAGDDGLFGKHKQDCGTAADVAVDEEGTNIISIYGECLAGVDEDGDMIDAVSDCDDGDADVYPGAEEICDGIDNNCDGEIDEGLTATYYADYDGDSFGDPAASIEACEQPAGYIADATDCDDSDPFTSPVADEVCDGVDNDCDGEYDEDDAVDGATWYMDGDGDGYGDLSGTVEACEQPSGYAPNSDDCDDGDWNTYPGAPEICDGYDNDCNGIDDSEEAVCE